MAETSGGPSRQIRLLLLVLLFCGRAYGSEYAYRHAVTYDTVWVGSGKIERTTRSFAIPREHVEAARELVGGGETRHRRRVYGTDDRVRIDPATDGARDPYNAVVRVSTGCSGMLISKRYVLAASHCVHNGNDYLISARLFLRAGYLQQDGRTKWTFVKRFFVPAQWKNQTQSGEHQYNDWDEFDFSVLELAEDLGSQRGIMKPGLSGLFCDNKKSVHGAGTTVEFVSFPDDKSREAMWLDTTSIVTESPHLLYFEGDAWHGSSGAALYAWDNDPSSDERERRVMGVLSGNRVTTSDTSVQGRFNVAARLNPLNLLLVCHWIGEEEQCRQHYSNYYDTNDMQTIICDPR